MRESATTHSIALLVRTPTHGRQFMSQTTERTATPRTDRNAIKIINQSVRIEALDGIRLGRRDCVLSAHPSWVSRDMPHGLGEPCGSWDQGVFR